MGVAPDEVPARPANSTTPGTATGGLRARLTTGALLTKVGARVGQPTLRPGHATRRPLLPTAAPVEETIPAAARLLLDTLAASDPDAPTRAHAIAGYAAALAEALAPVNEVPRIRHAALLCNIGMVVVPSAVLRKTTPLTPDEQQLIRRHPIHGTELLQKHPDLAELILPVLHHHEDHDGSGYPYGLSGDWIPLGARIIRVAETYDALLQPRPYRLALAPIDALAALHAGSGRLFDPRCVAALATFLGRA
jgi:HD-GYP domain-containing protein (c-di-GMP phosphodiesterase class II)